MVIDIGLDLARAKEAHYKFVQDSVAVTEENDEGRAELNLIFAAQSDQTRIQLLKENDD